MNDASNFISFNGLTANVQVARALIDEYNIELSTVIQHIGRLDEKKVEAEKALIEDLRAREKIELQQLAAKFQLQRAPLEDEKRSLEAKVDGAKGAIAPIRKLPAEILGNVFREVVWDGVSPWLLATVSKSWRITSLTTPSLWSNIHLGKFEHRSWSHSRWTVDGKPRYTIGNRMLCRTLEQLAYSAERSGVVPLDVLMDWNLTRDQDEVLQGLLGEPYSSRISSISLSSAKSKEEMADWTIGRFPSLRNLCCRSLQEPVIELILSQTVQLHTLTVLDELSSALLEHPMWHSLRVLHLGYFTQVADFNGIVSGLSLVEKFSGVPDSWPNEFTPNVTLEHIKIITISCPPKYLARVRLPRLQSLYWTGTNADSSDSDHEDVEPQWNLTFPSVTYFKARSSGDGFESALKYLPNVHTVLIDPFKVTYRDAWVLELLKGLASVENMLCPEFIVSLWEIAPPGLVQARPRQTRLSNVLLNHGWGWEYHLNIWKYGGRGVRAKKRKLFSTFDRMASQRGI